MNEEEAIQLLTYNLPKQAPSQNTSELAQHLHCWPLLLNLVHGQLSVCVREQHIPLAQAIGHIQEQLKEKGLNAFDVDKRRSAVIAAAESSIGLLSPDELHALQKLILSVGFSIPVPIALLRAMLKISNEGIEKLCRRLIHLGLISPHQFMIAPNNKAIATLL